MRQTFSKILCSNKNYQKILSRKYYIIAKATVFKENIKELRTDSFYNITNIIVVVLENESIILRQTKKLVLIINMIYAFTLVFM